MERWEELGLRGGVWQGVWHAPEAPGAVGLIHAGERVGAAEVEPLDAGRWRITARLPADLLTLGTSCLMLMAGEPGTRLIAALPLHVGAGEEPDLRAEMELMRAELDFLKREFRNFAGALMSEA
ncbi:hypothetical protein GI374_09250 [Paracoccus sp. S-4012]|uniref:hypothetical protein n=1 Tax=Paracoccus sp. S-4012 TaxID=2665648 RepID=UPI0012B11EBA|nr:hypothetical protein [Paracoccus sp. S-4012]MRX50629.1 hypothetical protein [Paracoccus sp. S-4012]